MIPTLGSKEAIFSFAQVVLDLAGGRDTVVLTEPGYPVGGAARSSRARGSRSCRCSRRTASCPTSTRFPPRPGARTALLWVNYPNNPTGATAPLAFYERLAALAREHDFVLASDEAYSELWFDEPPVSALQLDDRTNLAVFNTLSKRSSMTGYRSGFVARRPEIVAALKQFRPTSARRRRSSCSAPRSSPGATRSTSSAPARAYAAKRELLLDLFARVGLRDAGRPGDDVPLGRDARRARRRRRSRRACSSTASSSRPARSSATRGEGYVRFALVPTLEECRRAVEILERVL